MSSGIFKVVTWMNNNPPNPKWIAIFVLLNFTSINIYTSVGAQSIAKGISKLNDEIKGLNLFLLNSKTSNDSALNKTVNSQALNNNTVPNTVGFDSLLGKEQFNPYLLNLSLDSSSAEKRVLFGVGTNASDISAVNSFGFPGFSLNLTKDLLLLSTPVYDYSGNLLLELRNNVVYPILKNGGPRPNQDYFVTYLKGSFEVIDKNLNVCFSFYNGPNRTIIIQGIFPNESTPFATFVGGRGTQNIKYPLNIREAKNIQSEIGFTKVFQYQDARPNRPGKFNSQIDSIVSMIWKVANYKN